MNNEWKTAAQFRAEEAGPEYRARRAAAEKAHQARIEEFAGATRPIVDALRAAGLRVDALDLDSLGPEVARAIPVLLEQLRQDHPRQVKVSMLRALARPEARLIWPELVEMFRSNSIGLPEDDTYIIAAVLEAAADGSVLDDVLRLVVDGSLGLARAPLLYALKRSKNPKAKMMLMELATDPDLAREVKKLRRVSRMQTAAGKGDREK